MAAISKEAKDNIEAKQLTVLADKGYHTGKELQACQEAAIDTIVARQELVNSNTKGTQPDYMVHTRKSINIFRENNTFL